MSWIPALLTAQDAAARLGVSSSRVRQLCLARGIGHHHGRDWLLTEAEVQALRDRPGPGRPKRSPRTPGLQKNHKIFRGNDSACRENRQDGASGGAKSSPVLAS
jgi:hypothetical protein